MVRFFDDLLVFTCKYLYPFYLYHLQNISHDQGYQYICIYLSSIVMKQLSSNKILINIYNALRNHLFHPGQLNHFISRYIHPFTLVKKLSYEHVCQVHTSCWIPSVWIIISNYFFHYWYILWQYIPFIVDDNLSLVLWLDLDIFLITILFCIILSYPDVSILLAQSHCVFSWLSTLEYIICLFHWTHCKIIIFVSTIVYFRVLF